MMKDLLVLVFLILLSFQPFAQKLKSPVWDQSTVSFETAKIKSLDLKTKKYGPETYKTAFVKIERANMNSAEFTIDIPDKFYLKGAENYSIEYKLDDDGEETLTYTLIKDKQLVSVSFIFGYLADRPRSIFVNVIEDINAKTQKNENYILSEIK